MQDGADSSVGQQADLATPPLAMPPSRKGSAKPILLSALVAFLLGGGLAGWLVWNGELDRLLPRHAQGAAAPVQAAGNLPAAASAKPGSTGTLDVERASLAVGGVETRLALLEARFSRIDQQAQAASANAARAEALLIAFAARRLIDKGQPLGFVEYQLKLRFGSAQPQAVQTIVNAARDPVTLYLLSSQLAAAAPALSGERRNEGAWDRFSRELASLFVVRRTPSPTTTVLDRAERAQVLLKAGQIDEAITEVEHLPGADDAQDWIAAARRYADAQRALDVIETAAMLEPRGLRDGTGLAVDQPSPLAPAANR